MTNPGQILTLSYRTVAGELVHTSATTLAELEPAAVPLHACALKLEDGTKIHQVVALHLIGTGDRERGYRMIDSQILAGLRLARRARDDSYPPQVARLIGYEADSAEPFALFAPYRGEAAAAVAGHLLPAGQYKFQVSLLVGLRWLAEAGIAHRGISPVTVRWDGDQVQITDFSLATVFGVSREVVGTRPWTAPEQRPDMVSGDVGERDDIWAAGRLIYYVTTGEELNDRDQLRDWPMLMDLLAGVFGPPEQRPTARELLARLREPDPVPPGAGADPRLEKGRADFHAARVRRHGVGGQAESSARPSEDQVGARKPRLRVWPFVVFFVSMVMIGIRGVS